MQVLLQIVAFSLQTDESGWPLLSKGRCPWICVCPNQRSDSILFCFVCWEKLKAMLAGDGYSCTCGSICFVVVKRGFTKGVIMGYLLINHFYLTISLSQDYPKNELLSNVRESLFF